MNKYVFVFEYSFKNQNWPFLDPFWLNSTQSLLFIIILIFFMILIKANKTNCFCDIFRNITELQDFFYFFRLILLHLFRANFFLRYSKLLKTTQIPDDDENNVARWCQLWDTDKKNLTFFWLWIKEELMRPRMSARKATKSFTVL